MKGEKFPGRWILTGICVAAACLWLGGCGQSSSSGYSSETLYPEGISTVYVEMFDSRSFRRGHEYDLTDAIAKRIEAETPYKIVSDRNVADSVISGYLGLIGDAILTGERQTGSPLEKEFELTATVTWKNMKTGELLLDGQEVSASASYSPFQRQTAEYASRLAANRLAERIVETMQKSW